MHSTLRIWLLLLGSAWAQVLLIAGFAMLFASLPLPARVVLGVSFLCAGYFVAMTLVIDRLVTDASPVFIVTLKAVCVLTFCLCLGLTIYGILTGRAAGLMLPD